MQIDYVKKPARNYLYGKAVQKSTIPKHMESDSATFLASTNCCAKLQSQSRSASVERWTGEVEIEHPFLWLVTVRKIFCV